MNNWKKHILLENPEYFDFGNGLWTGKKPPFKIVTVIRNTNFTDSGKIDYSNVAVLEVEKKQFDQRKLIKGDIVIERSGGGPKQPVGRVVYFDKDDGDFSFSNFTSRIRVINDEFDTIFVFYFLMYFYEAGNTFEMQAQTTGIRNLDFTKYKNSVRIPLIPLPEQRKIAYILSTVQKAIEQQDKLIRTTTELKKALMQKLFTEGTKGEKQKQTEIGLVPESWEVVELDEICERVSINVQPNPHGEMPYVGLEHIVPGQIYLSTWGKESDVVSSKAQFKKGEILYGKLRPYLDKAAIAHFDGMSSTDILIFTGKNDVQNEFLIHFFHTEQLIDYAKSTTTGVQHPRTSWSSLKKLKLALPPNQERKLITQSLNLLEDKLSFLVKKKQTLSDLFKTLLHELMTGQRRVHELEFEGLAKQYELKEQPLSMAAE